MNSILLSKNKFRITHTVLCIFICILTANKVLGQKIKYKIYYNYTAKDINHFLIDSTLSTNSNNWLHIHIQDCESKPIEYVHISLLGKDSTLKYGYKSDSNGNCRTRITADEYNIQIKNPQCQVFDKLIKFQENYSYKLEITLHRKSHTGSILILSNRKPKTSHLESLKTKEIENCSCGN